MPDHNEVDFHEMDLEQDVIRKLSQMAATCIVVREVKARGTSGNSLHGVIHLLEKLITCPVGPLVMPAHRLPDVPPRGSSLRAIFLHCRPKLIDAHSWIVSRFHFGAAPPGCGDAALLHVIHAIIIQRVAEEADQFRPFAIARLRHKICDFRIEHGSRLARPSVFDKAGLSTV